MVRGLNEEMETLRFDRRLVDWNINRGIVEPNQYEEYLKSLPDEGANAENLQLEDGASLD